MLDGDQRLPRRVWAGLAIVRGWAVRYLIGLLAVALVTVEGVLLARHLGDVRAALAKVSWWLLLGAVAAQLVSIAGLAAMYRRMLHAGGLGVPLRRVGAVVVAANALSATLPAGSALATGYGFQRLRRFGASAPLAGWTVLVTGLVSGATLAVLGVAGAVVVGSRAAGTVTAALSVGAVLALGLALRTAMRHPQLLRACGERLHRALNRLLRREPDAGAEWVQHFVTQLAAIRPGVVDWLAAAVYAALKWAGDVACLVLACRAVGISHLSARVVLITYAADAGASLLQLLPGGLGTVDGALVLALFDGGIPAASATAGVLIYRLISFVFMAVVGWIVWFLLRGGCPNDRTSGCHESATSGLRDDIRASS